MIKISDLKKIGTVPQNPQIGFVVWGKSHPKPLFNFFVKISHEISSIPIKIFIDDVCSQIVFDRAKEEQDSLNKEFRYFFRECDCKVTFSSEAYLESDFNFTAKMMEISNGLTSNLVNRYLPKNKQVSLKTSTYSEVIHPLLQLIYFDFISYRCDSIIMGPSGIGMLKLHRKICKHPLSGIVVRKI